MSALLDWTDLTVVWLLTGLFGKLVNVSLGSFRFFFYFILFFAMKIVFISQT